MNRRRIIIVLILIVVLGLISLAGYWLLGGSSGSGDAAGNLPEIGGEFDPAENVDPEALAEATVPVANIAAYHVYEDGSIIAVHRDGTIDRVVEEDVTSLSNKPVEGFASASFSGDGSRILVLTGNQPRTQVNIFETESATWRVVPGTFRDATWAPTGSQLATLTPDPTTGKTAIGIYDAANGRTVRTIVALALGDVSIDWPNAQTILVSDKPNQRSNGSTWAINVSSGVVSVAARGKLGYAARWNDAAQSALAFQANQYRSGGRTKLIVDGVEQAVLSFTTMPDKCAFFDMPMGEDEFAPYVVCGVPRDQDDLQRKNLPEAYYRKEFFSDDVLVGVNLETRSVEFTIATPTTVDATDLRVVDGSTIYYLDRATGALYKSTI
jgi:hypothetical protein